jgi:hypothetical protein
MDTSKLLNAGIQMRTVDEALEQSLNQWQYEKS